MAEENDVEETLDRDYFLFLSMAKTYFPQLKEDKEATLCSQWLTKLCGEKVRGVSQKRNRNLFLLYLVMYMQEGKLSGPFSKRPEDGPLPPANIVFGSPQSDDSELEEEPLVGDATEDFQERSGDGRTYVAVRCLPDNNGTYAFVAINLDPDEDECKDVTIVPCLTDKSKIRRIQAMSKLTSDTFDLDGGTPSELQMEDFYIRNIEVNASDGMSEACRELNFTPGRSCGRIKDELPFYNVLLKEIDKEIKGVVASDNELLKFLVSRLKQDLAKIPNMQHIRKLPTDQQNLKILEILRQKLILRQQEQKRRNILAEMEASMRATITHAATCISRSEPTDSMWQLAVTKPLVEADIEKLYKEYPEEAISVFLDLLADDRQVILERAKKRQANLIENVRSEVYKEVQSGRAEYKKAREAYREWNEILSLIEEMMYEVGTETMQEIPQQREKILLNMISNIKDVENLVVEEAHRGEVLTEKIVDANNWTFSTQEPEGSDISWEIKSMIVNMRKEIEAYRLITKKQEQRIQQLRDELDYV